MGLGGPLLIVVISLAASLASSAAGTTHPQADDLQDRGSIPPRFLRGPTITPNPNPRAPLSALVEYTADRPLDTVLEVSDGRKSWWASFKSTQSRSRRLPVLGLSPERRYSVTITVTDDGGNSFVWTEPLEIFTGPLPEDFPPLRLETSEPDKMEPGITLFNVTRYESPTYGLLVAVDESGEVIWYFQADHPIGTAIQLRSGNLLYLHLRGAIEIDWLGNVIRQWHPAAREFLGKPGSIPVDTDSFHHDICELEGGTFLALSTELRTMGGYPASETDPSAPAETAGVVGDVIVEFSPDGRILRQWSLFDLLDAYRIGYDSLGGFWNSTYGSPQRGTRDWTHANAIFHDSSDDSILVSLRHQDALIKFSRSTGEMMWILGTHDDWNVPWNRHLLEPVGDLQWPFHQHASIVTPEDTILAFDNGNFRARPFAPGLATSESYSRVVEYRVDETRRTVSQVWAYGGSGEEGFYSPFGGSAFWLPQTGNILLTDSARITDDRGNPTENTVEARRWARIVELTHTTPARKVFELVVGEHAKAGQHGWSVYRSRRIRAMYAPSQNPSHPTKSR